MRFTPNALTYLFYFLFLGFCLMFCCYVLPMALWLFSNWNCSWYKCWWRCFMGSWLSWKIGFKKFQSLGPQHLFNASAGMDCLICLSVVILLLISAFTITWFLLIHFLFSFLFTFFVLAIYRQLLSKILLFPWTVWFGALMDPYSVSFSDIVYSMTDLIGALCVRV